MQLKVGWNTAQNCNIRYLFVGTCQLATRFWPQKQSLWSQPVQFMVRNFREITDDGKLRHLRVSWRKLTHSCWQICFVWGILTSKYRQRIAWENNSIRLSSRQSNLERTQDPTRWSSSWDWLSISSGKFLTATKTSPSDSNAKNEPTLLHKYYYWENDRLIFMGSINISWLIQKIYLVNFCTEYSVLAVYFCKKSKKEKSDWGGVWLGEKDKKLI